MQPSPAPSNVGKSMGCARLSGNEVQHHQDPHKALSSVKLSGCLPALGHTPPSSTVVLGLHLHIQLTQGAEELPAVATVSIHSSLSRSLAVQGSNDTCKPTRAAVLAHPARSVQIMFLSCHQEHRQQEHVWGRCSGRSWKKPASELPRRKLQGSRRPQSRLLGMPQPVSHTRSAWQPCVCPCHRPRCYSLGTESILFDHGGAAWDVKRLLMLPRGRQGFDSQITSPVC